MISLGLDPGGKKGTAWAVYDSESDWLTVGVEKPREWQDPACSAWEMVGSLVVRHKVTVVGVEVPHIPRLPKSALPHEHEKLLVVIYAQGAAALKLAEVVGACKAAAYEHECRVVDLQPATIKQAITGKGNASKEQVRRMVETLYGARMEMVRNPREKKVLREDEADATAIALAAQRRVE